MAGMRRWRVVALSVIFTVTFFYYLNNKPSAWNYGYSSYIPSLPKNVLTDGRVHWTKLPEKFPVTSMIPLPTGMPKKIPAVQAPPPTETSQQKEERLKRRAAVAESFNHSWAGYKKNAWLRDEVAPLSGKWKDTFGGWAATLVDSLDTLWIVGLKDEFEVAVKAIEEIDFTTTDEKDINIFETTIRYMGGFLAAYDISDAKYPTLLAKAVEVGELVMSCFDTPNRMPITRWDWKKYMSGEPQAAPMRTLVSELGSLSLEFTRLTQLTGDPKYYDAVQRIGDVFEESQNTTKLPGMWPITVDPSIPSFSDDSMFTLGGMSDSLYEYFPKQYLILGGLLEQPKHMYEEFIKVAKAEMFFKIYNPKNEPILVSGDIRMAGTRPTLAVDLQPRGQHLTCFTGGMVALAARIFDRPDDIATAEQLTAGCVWAYDSNQNGIAPEIFTVIPCPKNGDCTWTDDAYYDALATRYPVENGVTETIPSRDERVKEVAKERHLVPGITELNDRRYILRPEAIESVFIMYRVTGDQKWQDIAWRMFQAVEKVSRTDMAAAAIIDITAPKDQIKLQQMDSMESFWLAETLKYFYLCFEEWGNVSLDDYVLNTEAHPLKRPGRLSESQPWPQISQSTTTASSIPYARQPTPQSAQPPTSSTVSRMNSCWKSSIWSALARKGLNTGVAQYAPARVLNVARSLQGPKNNLLTFIPRQLWLIQQGWWDAITALLLSYLPNLQELEIECLMDSGRYIPQIMEVLDRGRQIGPGTDSSPTPLIKLRRVSLEYSGKDADSGMDLKLLLPFL
ncbi:hypothetical protein G7Y89_g11674 [Cudoniella acicularis]|uniref:alpha-1,2-Mannosidase n=1 Tax=Cudoniella acicularis TaxID=354080 RepID=A0A8H4W0F5_9HELO|nr:hypothetical protein G7Y89_g11674 [Cudoniella acicularis]